MVMPSSAFRGGRWLRIWPDDTRLTLSYLLIRTCTAFVETLVISTLPIWAEGADVGPAHCAGSSRGVDDNRERDGVRDRRFCNILELSVPKNYSDEWQSLF